jgi:ankyrin repeat protein
MDNLMKSIAFLNIIKEKFTASKEDRKEKELKKALEEFIRFCSLKLEWDHPYEVYHQEINNFTDKYIKSGKISPHQELNGTFQYTHHFNDTWKEHSLTKRFHRKYEFDMNGATLLHLACLTGSDYMINALLEAGADKSKKNNKGNTPEKFLFYNENYITLTKFEKLKEKFNEQKPSLKLVKR